MDLSTLFSIKLLLYRKLDLDSVSLNNVGWKLTKISFEETFDNVEKPIYCNNMLIKMRHLEIGQCLT